MNAARTAPGFPRWPDSRLASRGARSGLEDDLAGHGARFGQRHRGGHVGEREARRDLGGEDPVPQQGEDLAQIGAQAGPEFPRAPLAAPDVVETRAMSVRQEIPDRELGEERQKQSARAEPARRGAASARR